MDGDVEDVEDEDGCAGGPGGCGPRSWKGRTPSSRRARAHSRFEGSGSAIDILHPSFRFCYHYLSYSNRSTAWRPATTSTLHCHCKIISLPSPFICGMTDKRHRRGHWVWGCSISFSVSSSAFSTARSSRAPWPIESKAGGRSRDRYICFPKRLAAWHARSGVSADRMHG